MLYNFAGRAAPGGSVTQLLIRWSLSTSTQAVSTLHYSPLSQACGLLQHDNEWRAALAGAALFYTGERLRHLFVLIIIHNEPAEPHLLWEQFKPFLCDDLQRTLRRHGFLNAPNEYIFDCSHTLLLYFSSLCEYEFFHPLPQTPHRQSETTSCFIGSYTHQTLLCIFFPTCDIVPSSYMNPNDFICTSCSPLHVSRISKTSTSLFTCQLF
ncbi:hypothetical protein BC827DRAFT_864009 [Russula dissimulans]|nr:hypothetical protein BC827DRAFT_864009 [Russula dissimulans]